MGLGLIYYCENSNNKATMDRFHAIEAFVKVVEAGSFARAADRLGVSVSSVSRHVTELEAHLGARLLNRTTRTLSLTEVGRAFHERSVQLMADLDEAEEAAGAGAVVPRGTLRLTCGITFGTRHLAPAVAEFMTRYPDMRFDLELSDRIVDLVDEGFDAAVRIGPIGGMNLVGRRVGATTLVCCAAPAYLARRGEPRVPEDLAAHTCLTYAYAPLAGQWPFRSADGGARNVRVNGPAHANNGSFLARARDRRRRHRLRARLHRRAQRAVGPPRTAPARVRARAFGDQRRLSEPAAPLGQGPRLHRLPRAALRDRAVVARGQGHARQGGAVIVRGLLH